jgi:hypothetical protein
MKRRLDNYDIVALTIDGKTFREDELFDSSEHRQKQCPTKLVAPNKPTRFLSMNYTQILSSIRPFRKNGISLAFHNGIIYRG